MIIFSQSERMIVNMNNGIIYTDGVYVNYMIDGKTHMIGTYEKESNRAIEVVKNIYGCYKLGHTTYEMPKK